MKLAFYSPLLCAGLLVLATITLKAQSEIGVMLGIGLYQGDLAPSGIGPWVASAKPSMGVYARIPFSERLAFNGYIQSSKIQGSDAQRPSSTGRNLSFQSNIFEFGAVAEIYPFGISRNISPFISGGASVYRFNPEALFNGRYVELQPLGTEGQGMNGFAPKYSLTRFAVPLGAGVRVAFGSAWVVGAQFKSRLTFFDHLDDVSGNYVNYYELVQGNGSLSAALADRTHELTGTDNRDIPTGVRRGDPANNDWLYTATITVGYRLGTGLFGGSGSSRSSGSRYNKCYQF